MSQMSQMNQSMVCIKRLEIGGYRIIIGIYDGKIKKLVQPNAIQRKYIERMANKAIEHIEKNGLTPEAGYLVSDNTLLQVWTREYGWHQAKAEVPLVVVNHKEEIVTSNIEKYGIWANTIRTTKPDIRGA